MASIWKHPASPYYYCCYTDPSGKRLKRSTKQSNRQKANIVCMEWSLASKRAGENDLTAAASRKVINDILEKTGERALSYYTTRTWFDVWLKNKTMSQGTKTAERYEVIVRNFLNNLGSRADKGLEHITVKDIQNFRDDELNDGKSPRTCNYDAKRIKSAFIAARKQGYIQTNPVDALEMLPEKTSRKKTFTSELVAELLGAAPSEDWKGAIIMGFYTGARLSDIANMRWDNVELTDSLLRFVASKTGKEVVIPFHPDLLDHLTEIATGDDPKAFVFPSLADRPTGGAHGLSRRFRDIMEDVGIKVESDQKKTGKGRNVSPLSFHSLRHSFNSAMANHGVSQEVRQELTGHSSEEMNRHYTHHEIETLRKAVDVVPSLKPRSPQKRRH